MKKCTLAGSLLALCLSLQTSAQFSTACLTDSINICTGANHIGGGLYASSRDTNHPVLDKFWQITTLPTNTKGYTAPTCAKMFWSDLSGSPSWSSSADCAYLGFIADPEVSNTIQIAPMGNFFWNCPNTKPYKPTMTPTTFTRSFYVQSSTKEDIIIDIPKVWGDDYVQIFLDGTTPIYIDNTTATTPGVSIAPLTINVSAGLHTIDVKLWDIAGVVTGMKLRGSIKAKKKVLVSNTCFGFTDENCKLDKQQLSVEELHTTRVSVVPVPNPAAQSASLRIELPLAETVAISILDLSGRELSLQIPGRLEGGVHLIPLNTDQLSSGLYLVKLQAGTEITTTRLELLR